MFRELSPDERATVILALEAWAQDRGERADKLQTSSPALSLVMREESERAAALALRADS